MTVYAWPATRDWAASRFELRVLPNLRVFTGAYTANTDVLDLLGERWVASIDLPPTESQLLGGEREAFFDRLKGAANKVALWNLRRPAPMGTARGTLTLGAPVAQLANTCSIAGAGAGSTLKAGDMLSLAGQLVRVMESVVANGAGTFTSVEFQPRARAAMASGAAVLWDKPTATFILKGDGVPTVHRPGMVEGCSFELVEAP